MKLQAFDSNCFLGKSSSGDDDTQNYLVFQLVLTCFKKSSNSIFEMETKRIVLWKH